MNSFEVLKKGVVYEYMQIGDFNYPFNNEFEKELSFYIEDYIKKRKYGNSLLSVLCKYEDLMNKIKILNINDAFDDLTIIIDKINFDDIYSTELIYQKLALFLFLMMMSIIYLCDTKLENQDLYIEYIKYFTFEKNITNLSNDGSKYYQYVIYMFDDLKTII